MNYLKNVKFIKSVFDKENIIKDNLPIVAMVGKSNVGKSSFINALTNNKNTAKVGNTPGKTKCINYFNVSNELYLVDLPGYGYSTMSKTEKENINKLTNYFLEKNKNIKYIFLLVDIRHMPSEEDKLMYNWLAGSNIPFCIILNKADKLTENKQIESVKEITKALFAKEELIPFSSKNSKNLDVILNHIYEIK